MSSNPPAKYYYIEETHNLDAPGKIVPVVLDFVKPQSVIDVGCGTGTFLKIFKDHGIHDILGIDGTWVNRSMLHQNIDEKDFREVDLEKLSFEQVNRTFDLAVCLEVAEHLAPESADLLVSNLTRFSRFILFSAAIPYQGGINHVNEQWPEYWKKKFSKHGFFFYDVIRPHLWENPTIPYWYKQNIFLVCRKEDAPPASPVQNGVYDNVVHPDLFTLIAGRLDKTENMQLSTVKYMKMLAKKMLGRGRR
jgi:SAM-dependent methyltransferase